jgi:hypothetical protein
MCSQSVHRQHDANTSANASTLQQQQLCTGMLVFDAHCAAQVAHCLAEHHVQLRLKYCCSVTANRAHSKRCPGNNTHVTCRHQTRALRALSMCARLHLYLHVHSCSWQSCCFTLLPRQMPPPFQRALPCHHRSLQPAVDAAEPQSWPPPCSSLHR